MSDDSYKQYVQESQRRWTGGGGASETFTKQIGVLRQGLQVVKVQGGKHVTVQAKGALPSLHIHAIQNGEVETGQVCLQTAQLAGHLGKSQYHTTKVRAWQGWGVCVLAGQGWGVLCVWAGVGGDRSHKTSENRG